MILFLRHGLWPYSGDRHNAEFFEEFVNRSTNLGADYGVMLTTIQSRLVDWRGFAREAVNQRLAGKADLDLGVSEEAASRIIRAMTLDRPFYDVANLPYLAGRGERLPGVPEGAVIESMCSYDGSGAHPGALEPLHAIDRALALMSGAKAAERLNLWTNPEFDPRQDPPHRARLRLDWRAWLGLDALAAEGTYFSRARTTAPAAAHYRPPPRARPARSRDSRFGGWRCPRGRQTRGCARPR